MWEASFTFELLQKPNASTHLDIPGVRDKTHILMQNLKLSQEVL